MYFICLAVEKWFFSLYIDFSAYRESKPIDIWTFCTVRGYKFNHLAINSTTAVATEARVNPALPATAVVKMAKWHGTYCHPLLKIEIVAENPLSCW